MASFRIRPFPWVVLLALATAPALAQDSKTLTFSIKPDKEKRALFGAVVRQGDTWKVHSIGLTVHSVNVKKQTCRISLSGQGIVKHKRKQLHKGEPNGYQLIPGEPPIVLWVDQTREDLCEGHLSIASPTAANWRGLSGGSFEEVPRDEIAEKVTQAMGPSVIPPEVVAKSTPEYTQAALEKRIEGDCLIRLVIGEDGSVDPESILVFRTVGYGLDEAAIEDVLNSWKFIPATKDGKPVAVIVVVEITFSLRE